jgi:hypothetical protein
MKEEIAISEAEYLRTMWKRKECPQCHSAIPDRERVGTGQKADGGFCGLNCYTSYYTLELAEKARLFAREAHRFNEF